jgi:hypothetical protein
MSNVRRIQCYLESKIMLENEQRMTQKEQEGSQKQPLVSFFVFLYAIFCVWMAPKTLEQVEFGY